MRRGFFFCHSPACDTLLGPLINGGFVHRWAPAMSGDREEKGAFLAGTCWPRRDSQLVGLGKISKTD